MVAGKVVTASLEGMRVLVMEKNCELQEYNFATDKWQSKEILPWPLRRSVAEEWLAGWNGVDQFAAMNVLTEVGGDHDSVRSSSDRILEPRP